MHVGALSPVPYPLPPVPSTDSAEKPRIAPDVLQQLHQIEYPCGELQSDRHSHRLLVFVGLYALAASGAVWLTQSMTSTGGLLHIAAPWSYAICLPLYLLAAASLHGISLFAHEGVHGVLSANPHWNRSLSILCALPVLQNFSAYKVLHLKHHQHLGIEGDPDHYKNYTRWNGLLVAMYWGRLLIGYPVYITAIPILGFRQGTAIERVWIIAEVMLLGLLATIVLLSSIPTDLLLHGWLIPMLLINSMVNIRGMSQHTLLEHESDVIRGTRTILTNPVTRFFMCNENYHLEHHLYPAVPWYHLPRLHAALRDELAQRGAPYISSYFTFVRDFAIASLHRTPVGSVASQFPPNH